MKWKTILCCFFLCFTWDENVASPRIFKSIAELKNVADSFCYPRHGCKLLYFAAHKIFEKNLHLYKNVDPRRGDYGFHSFKNHEKILPDPSSGYFSMGNLNSKGSSQLDPYVMHDFYQITDPRRNMDRLIVSLSRDSELSRMFLTAHHLKKNTFDPDQTIEIAPKLIQEIQEIHDLLQYLTELGYKFGDGEIDCIIRNFSGRPKRTAVNLETKCNLYTEVKLDIKSTEKGYAKITWEGIPDKILNTIAYIGLYKNADSENALVKVNSPVPKSGASPTTIPLNPGLQLRLVKYDTVNGINRHTPFLNGSEFDEANRVLPTEIKGYSASLQLYTKDGYACARLYIEKSFTGWKKEFGASWVGFYTSNQDNFDKHKQRELCTKFTLILNKEEDYAIDYDIYEYQSKLSIGPGVQARFMLNDDKGSEKARTVSWEAP
ncbi:uncharacterized protein LOC118816898 [Colossoma macropomum]|uniref:uncharacterized protein LOC118816898 n=1 Tax=Colossoma macropomum TaxID=42526 RepID=UPI0018655119|nr:uncharacterized protein LOC118816898 [Colossoma macropomum]